MDIKVFLFDLDGTIYRDGVLIGNVKETLATLRAQGSKIAYLTNNSSCTSESYLQKLTKIGIYEEGDIIYSSLDCTVDFLKKNRAGKKVYPLAVGEVKAYLEAQGIAVMDNENAREADILLLTFDKELNYEKMVIANELMATGKEYIATHPDFVCPTRGISIPDAGSFIELFKASNGRIPDIVLGKPSTYMADFLIDGLGIQREQVMMVGDRLYTDIQFGLNAGVHTTLVLSGETTKEQYEKSGVKAEYVLANVNELQEIL